MCSGTSEGVFQDRTSGRSVLFPTPTDSGGFNYKYVDSLPDRLVCSICQFPSRDSHLSVCCGQMFCKSCLDGTRRATTINNSCPVCREEKFVTFPNKQADREIRSLRVMCTNKGRGCEWQGELHDINNHLGNSDGCQFEDVKCSNECGKMLQRQYLTGHIKTECPCRTVGCQYCHITGEHQFIEGEHKEQCPKIPLPCPNNCEVGSLPHEDMKAHRKVCPLEMVQCEYHNVGCEERIMQKDLEKHKDEKMKDHLSLTKSKLADATQQIEDTRQKLTSTQLKLADSEDRVRQQLELFKTETNCYLVNAFKDIDRLVVALHHSAVTNERASYTNGTTSVVSAATWWTKLTALAALLKSGDQVCPVILRIGNAGKSRLYFAQECIDHFYSHNKGYKMCLVVDTTHSRTHLSVFLYLMKGPHDNKLTWPLRGKFDVKLLNQISDCEHHSMTLVYNDRTPDDTTGRVKYGNRARGWGHTKFISNEDFYKVTPSYQFLKDDCIFFQVSKL